ncbi:Transposon Tf2-7 polyprotein [Rhizoctonia solani]|uniref:RNA-directed DNA polymerase n=1 Tax=Rhizoctonia solani TaxID=456999 RepID=A0A0K6FNX3_9AGAM|nr:Transposon Tf2-7 polyprotein [Rhizoctonia solani]
MATKGKSASRSTSCAGGPTPGPSTIVPPPPGEPQPKQPQYPLDPVFGEGYEGPAQGEPAEGNHLWSLLQLINRKLDAIARTIEVMENVSVEQGSAISDIKTTLTNLPSTPILAPKADPDPTPRVPRVCTPSISFRLGSPIRGRSSPPKRLSASPTSQLLAVTPGAPSAPQATPIRATVPATTLAPGSTAAPSVKIPPPEKFKGDGNQGAKTWIMEATVWFHVTAPQFGHSFEAQMLYLLSRTEGKAATWAIPHMARITSRDPNRIRDFNGFVDAFKMAFVDPDSANKAARKITELKQTGTAQDYTNKFNVLAAELDWNENTLMFHYTNGLNWTVRSQLANRENQPRNMVELKRDVRHLDNVRQELAAAKAAASHSTSSDKKKPSTTASATTTTTSTSTTVKKGPLKDSPNFVPLEEREARHTANLCIKCGSPDHVFAKCTNGWRKEQVQGKAKAETAKIRNFTSIDDSENVFLSHESKFTPLLHLGIRIGKDPAEILALIDSGATANFISPRIVESLKIPTITLDCPRTVKMLDGSNPGQGKIWKQVQIVITPGSTQLLTALVCNIGENNIILGSPWLKTENPEINWQEGRVSFASKEEVHIASEEEADNDPLQGVPPQYHEFAKVFGEEEFKKLPPHWPYDISIDLKPNAHLPMGPLYSMTELESRELKEWLDKELLLGKIRHSRSEAASPVMFVKKADGSLRLVVDYCKLNEATKKNVYPLPQQDDLMAKLQGSKIFTKLDLRWGYNNGLFETLVMPFGLTNAPAAFQHFMNDLFRDILDIYVIIYLDDILIFSKNKADHTEHVKEVLWRLEANQLFCKPSKCFFHKQEVGYLGMTISTEGVSMEEAKVKAVREWPIPKTKKQLHSFSGFANFLHQFVWNFSKIARPLHDLLHQDRKWDWLSKENTAFKELKQAITNAPVLIHPDPSKPYFLETNASGAAMGAVLSQRGEDAQLHPVAFMLESFSAAEGNYNTHDKELLAIIRSFENWRIFLEGTKDPITVFTDHQNLEYWKSSRTFNQRHMRWHMLLAGFNFEIHYRLGKQSGKPDALSRRSDHVEIPPEPQVMLPDTVFVNLASEASLQSCIENALDSDSSLNDILFFLEHNPEEAPATIKRAFRDYQMEAGILFYQGRIFVPDDKDIKRDLIALFHDAPTAGHPGQQQTLELIRHRYYWPGIRATVFKYVDTCEICQQGKLPKIERPPLQTLEVPSQPWVHISYDMIVGLPKDQGYGQTERVNPFIEGYLRNYQGASQDEWVKWLPMAEFAYNNAKHSATGMTPFFCLYGRNPELSPSTVKMDNDDANAEAGSLQKRWEEALSALRLSKARMTDGKEPKVSFAVGDRVWLDSWNIKLRTASTKLNDRRLGPFKVTKVISPWAYELELPNTLRIHKVFHVTLLSKVQEDPKRPFQPRPDPVTINGEEEYEVEDIVDSKRRADEWHYRVKWKGYGPESNTWEPKKNLEHAEEILKKYHQKLLKKAHDAAKGL